MNSVVFNVKALIESVYSENIRRENSYESMKFTPKKRKFSFWNSTEEKTNEN